MQPHRIRSSNRWKDYLKSSADHTDSVKNKGSHESNLEDSGGKGWSTSGEIDQMRLGEDSVHGSNKIGVEDSVKGGGCSHWGWENRGKKDLSAHNPIENSDRQVDRLEDHSLKILDNQAGWSRKDSGEMCRNPKIDLSPQKHR